MNNQQRLYSLINLYLLACMATTDRTRQVYDRQRLTTESRLGP